MATNASTHQSNASTQPSQQQPTIYEYLTELVSKRIATITYLRQTHEGNTHWFNTILLTKDDLNLMYSNVKMLRRTCHFYTLGVSLSALLDITNPWDYTKALYQLLTEFELHTMDHSKQKMKNIFRKAKAKDDPNLNEGAEYLHLTIPHIPFELDYFETFFSFSDILVEAYQKMLVGVEGASCTQSYLELVLKCDGKIKKTISLITKELDGLARNAIKDELKLIDPLSHSNKIAPIDFDGADP
ncbi:hypothetical protein EC973_008459 [Apophysomyces ossiformis]|uniref:Uncharacterized protein n=1 Tax=Apophysomyces ossiformis TaxID=679940 RepID=A0A8H7EPU7_9FUNG|nr:hypothetical protein EC973_008459 [Apophysomyces ossiformis]